MTDERGLKSNAICSIKIQSLDFDCDIDHGSNSPTDVDVDLPPISDPSL